jgi:hypothetical protein
VRDAAALYAVWCYPVSSCAMQFVCKWFAESDVRLHGLTREFDIIEYCTDAASTIRIAAVVFSEETSIGI